MIDTVNCEKPVQIVISQLCLLVVIRIMSSLATCQRCHQQFDTKSNQDNSCKFHRSLYVCRLHTEGKAYYGVEVGDWNGKFWDCCGAENQDAQPCAQGKHVSYDEEWSIDLDRFAPDNEDIILQGQPPFQCPKLPSHLIMDLIRESESTALENGFLKSYTPKPSIKMMDDLKYVVCLAENLANKPNNNKGGSKGKSKNSFNPFAGPFQSGAHVFDLGVSNEYRLILNKFPVLPHHVLLISSEWVTQTDPLTASDLKMAWNVFESLRMEDDNQNPMMFLNSGKMSGATQMHRHLHLIPNCGPSLLINEIADSLKKENGDSKEDENEMEEVSVLHFDRFSFLHGIIMMKDDVNGDILSGYYKILMQWMKKYVVSDTIDYNLIITERVVMIVPRRASAFHYKMKNKEKGNDDKEVAFPINAMPLSGMIFCSSTEQMNVLNEVGITRMIQHCCYPMK